MAAATATPTRPAAANSTAVRLVPLYLVALLLLATGLRFYRLDAQSFWNDEGNSARLSERTLPLIIEGTASDIHPPLYYVLLRGWREFLGDSEFGLRSFSAFAGVLTVAAALSLASLLLHPRARPGRRAGPVAVAGLLAAVNPALIYYSQETRMYALLALIGALATLILLRWLRDPAAWPWGLAYVAALTAGLYTHYFFPAVLALHGLYVLGWIVRRQTMLVFDPLDLAHAERWWQVPLYWLGLVAASLVLYLPWLPVFLRQAGGRTAVRGSLVRFAADSLRWMLLGETSPATGQGLVVGAAVLLLAWGGYVAGRRAIMPLLGVIVPIAMMYVAGTTQPAFFKFMLLAVPFLVVALAAGFHPARRGLPVWLQRLIPSLLLLALLAGTAVSLNNLYFNEDYARADYRGIAARIAASGQDGAGIILVAPNQWEVFTYYHRAGAPVYPLPKGQPDPAILEPELAQIAQQHSLLYVLFWGEEQRDPQRVIERWLDAHAYKSAEEWVGDVRFVIYAVPIETSVEARTAVNVPFGEDITLLSFALPVTTRQGGEVLPLTLVWSTAAPLADRYKVFVHLMDSSGQVVAQQDSEPGGGSQPTPTWQPGVEITDNHGVALPLTLPPGDYELLVGLYDVADPAARLPLPGGAGANDALSLGTIHVVAPQSE